MEEAADADYVVIIDAGKIVAEGTPIQLKNEYAGDYVTVYDIDDATAQTLGIPYEKVGMAHRFSVENTAQATELIIKYPQIFRDYEVVKGKMDSVFLSVTGKKLEGGDNK
jgi:multidrug/hemolysin transport system ATP-binding protein